VAAKPVEWVLTIYYGPTAHRATYGRQVRNPRYSKDYIQLPPGDPDFLQTFHRLFPPTVSGARVELIYQWPADKMPGALDYSSDRWHLKWETRLGAPPAWKMSLEPGEGTPETIPGDPSHEDFAFAEKELTLLASRGAGQPYLVAIKLRDESNRLHLRAYLAKPKKKYAWADIQLAPPEVQALAQKTTRTRAIAWATFRSGGVPPGEKVKKRSVTARRVAQRYFGHQLARCGYGPRARQLPSAARLWTVLRSATESRCLAAAYPSYGADRNVRR